MEFMTPRPHYVDDEQYAALQEEEARNAGGTETPPAMALNAVLKECQQIRREVRRTRSRVDRFQRRIKAAGTGRDSGERQTADDLFVAPKPAHETTD